MTATPRVSVVLPTYQRRESVRRAVASVLAQTLGDLELVVVDDGSTDGTDEVLAGVDDRLRYVRQENAGPAAARNHGIRLTSAPIVTFLDDDNRWLPDHLEVVTAVLDRHPEAMFASTCPRFILAGHDSPEDAELLDYRANILLYGSRAGFISCIAVRRAALERIGGLDERLRGAEDSDLLIRLGMLAPLAAVRRRTVFRQTTPESVSVTARRSGANLNGAELSAQNLMAAAGDLPAEDERFGFTDQARGVTQLARAIRAVDEGDAATLAAALEDVERLVPPAGRPNLLDIRIGMHLRRGGELAARLDALRQVSDLWPDPGADEARYLRFLAIVAALRLRRPREAARIARGWRGKDNIAFFRRIRPLLWERVEYVVQRKRHEASQT